MILIAVAETARGDTSRKSPARVFLRQWGGRGIAPTLWILPRNLARPERFELPTTWFVARYSIQLSYGRVAWELPM